MFSSLSEAEAEALSTRCSVLELADNEALFIQGDPARHLYVVLFGGLRLSCRGPDGSLVVVGTVGGGETLGEMGVIDTAPRSASATAMGRSRVLQLSGQAFLELVGQAHPATWPVMRVIRDSICARIRTLDERVDAVFELAAEEEVRPSEEGLGARVRAMWAAFSRGQL